jgi:hypothetical protein
LKTHPRQDETISCYRGNNIPSKWENAILGKLDRSELSIVDLPTLQDLKSRILKAIDFAFIQKLQNTKSRFFSTHSGLAWKEIPIEEPAVAPLNYHELYLQACSVFPAYLVNLLGDNNQYLDEHAGLKTSQLYPEVEAHFQKLMDIAPARRVVGVNLKKGKDSQTIGGTLVALHQFLSHQFLACYTVDHDASCAYMADYHCSSHKKTRKIRVSSLYHVNTKPVWLQFGDMSHVYLYLSQKASVAEEKWLYIINYVMKLLIEFVNSEIKRICGKHIPRNKLLRVCSFCTTVSSISHPMEGNYGHMVMGSLVYINRATLPTVCFSLWCLRFASRIIATRTRQYHGAQILVR